MKQAKLYMVLALLANVSVSHAQQIMLQKEIEGFPLECKTLANQKHACISLVRSDLWYIPVIHIEDKKLKQGENKYSSYPYLYTIMNNRLVSSPSHFYMAWITARPLEVGGIEFLNGAMFGKYDNQGNEQWLVQSSRSGGWNNYSPVILPDSNGLRTLYIDSTIQLVTELFSEEGKSLMVKTIPVEPGTLIGMFKTGTGRYMVSYRKEDSPGQQVHSYFLLFDDSANVLINKPIYPDSVNSYMETAIVHNGFIYTVTSFQDTITTKLQKVLTKFDLEGNIVKKLKLQDSYPTTVASICVSRDNQLYLGINTNMDNANYSFLQKVDTELNMKWSYQLPMTIYDIDTTLCNGIFIASYNPPPGTSFITKLTVIKDRELQDDVCDRCEITAYPNPTTDGIITCRTHHPDVFIRQSQWYDSNGKLVWQCEGDSNTIHAAPHHLMSGAYYTITTCDNDKTAQRRVIIAK